MRSARSMSYPRCWRVHQPAMNIQAQVRPTNATRITLHISALPSQPIGCLDDPLERVAGAVPFRVLGRLHRFPTSSSTATMTAAAAISTSHHHLKKIPTSERNPASSLMSGLPKPRRIFGAAHVQDVAHVLAVDLVERLAIPLGDHLGLEAVPLDVAEPSLRVAAVNLGTDPAV